MATKKDPNEKADDLVTANLLSALGVILFSSCLHNVTKSEVMRILKNAGLTDTDIAQLYSFTRRRLRSDNEARPV